MTTAAKDVYHAYHVALGTTNAPALERIPVAGHPPRIRNRSLIAHHPAVREREIARICRAPGPEGAQTAGRESEANTAGEVILMLYSEADHPANCLTCHQSRAIDHQTTTPGNIHYAPCACGEIGTYRPDDAYREIHKKKTNVAPYERSPYRGGKLL